MSEVRIFSGVPLACKLRTIKPICLLLILAGIFSDVARAELFGENAKLNIEPLTPKQSMAAAHVANGFKLQLVASEPLVRDPVAFDWSADGSLWVAEMADYPLGMNNKGEKGGRIRLLRDRDRDGRYDHSTIFLDNLSFPAGVMPWRNGVLVAAAPLLIFAADTNGDDKADIRQTLFEGFYEGNQQLRINGLYWGLDNTVHCAAGAAWSGYGGLNNIKSNKKNKSIAIRSGDFRFNPDSGWIEATSGPSQYGRVRDDWGNWFGVQNSHPLWHYVLSARYLLRNSDVTYPDSRHQVRQPRNPKVYINKPPQKRFHSFEQSGRFTSACGPAIYRDIILFDNNEITHAFTCEPFHNVIQRSILRENKVTFDGERADDGDKDFFASADRWSRPVFTRTGPDGALWFADMYRYMIEHPEWLPKKGQDELRPHFRSGEAFGRIYKIISKHKPMRKIPTLNGLKPIELTEHLSSENGTIRDIAHRLIVQSKDDSVAGRLKQIIEKSKSPKARLHALSALNGLDILKPYTVREALSDKHPYVRRLAFRLAEKFPEEDKAFAPFFDFGQNKKLNAQELKVVFQQILSAGSFSNQKIGMSLSTIFPKHESPYLEAAFLTASHKHYKEILKTTPTDGKIFEQLIQVGINKHRSVLNKKVDDIYGNANTLKTLQISRVWMKAMRKAGIDLDKMEDNGFPGQEIKLKKILRNAEHLALNSKTEMQLRLEAIETISHGSLLHSNTTSVLKELIKPNNNSILRYKAIESVANMSKLEPAKMLLATWPSLLAEGRKKTLDVLLSRSSWQEELLQAMETNIIPLSGFPALHRDRLLNSTNKSIVKRAKLIFDNTYSIDRNEVISKFLPALKLSGKTDDGKVTYESLCSQCHAPDKQLGPDLRSITDRSGEGLLNSIIDPSRQVDPKYIAYNAVFNDGRAIVGIIASESGDSLKINVPGVGLQSVNRNELKSLTSLNLSLMPTGLESSLTNQKMANLVEFLKNYK
ncbi:MAG: PVC-type heme-binding CxxCH protein [Verrucomicrobiota bacterium]|nr:PVC-type heme-binding CxxCH protein [Verrucomicrobiota bacterium]